MMGLFLKVIHIHMAITKAKKQTILAKLDGVKKDSESIVFVKFNGLGVQDSTAMRATLREEGVGYFVAKKTLMKRAFDGAFEGEMPALEGEIAVAYSTDAIAPAQKIKEFAGKYKDNLSIAGGVFQGVYKDAVEMTEIASIPALPVLRGMFVNVINSPIQGLVLGLNAIAEKKSA
ncbi:50S ribosomal protein L10 [Candidatus Kaiserbacteria bacterium]|nr:50S ribosomal protein L10 [Candidatus Kaiserbacteria bacterium]